MPNWPEKKIPLNPPLSKGEVRAVIMPHPFREAREVQQFRCGLSLLEMAAAAQPDPELRKCLRIAIDGREVPRAEWPHTCPRPKHEVLIRAVPQGKGVAGIFVAIAALVAAIVVPWALGLTGLMATFVGSLAGMTVSVVGGLIVNALIPPPRQNLRQLSGTSGATSPTMFIQGTRNQAMLFGPVPAVLGKHRMVPPYGTTPYTDALGDKQYVTCLFVWGHGPLSVTDLKLGDTIISHDGLTLAPDCPFKGVELESRFGAPDDPPLSLITESIHEEQLSVLLEYNTPQVRTTQAAVSDLSIDLTCPNGLAGFKPDGSLFFASVGIEICYRAAGSVDPAPWILVEKKNLLAATRSAVRQGVKWTPEDFEVWPSGQERQYDVRLMRFSTPDDATHISITYWTALRSFHPGEPLNFPQPLAVTALRIQASDQLNGTVDQLNALVQTISGALTLITEPNTITDEPHYVKKNLISTGGHGEIPGPCTVITDQPWYEDLGVTRGGVALTKVDYPPDAGEYSVSRACYVFNFDDCDATFLISYKSLLNCSYEPFTTTQNPADLYRLVLQGPANARPLPDSRLDLAQLNYWRDFCTTKGFTYNKIIDYNATVQDLLHEIAAAGRATPHQQDGLWTVVIDEPQTVPVQHFTPRNSWGFEGQKVFHELPHAFRVRFFNEQQNYRQDEFIVYDDGYSRDNASKFETLELPGITDPNLIHKHGRYHIACARLRPETYVLSCDLEHLAGTRGDLIQAAHDVTLWGLAWGRVKTLQYNEGGGLLGVTLDEALVMEAGKSYSLRFRLSSGDTLLCPLVTMPGEIPPQGRPVYSVEEVADFEAEPDIEAIGAQGAIFVTPIPPGQPQPAAGDLAMFGETDLESAPLLLKGLQYGPNLGAKLTLVDYNPAIYQADQGPIPPHNSLLSPPPSWSPPGVTQIRSDLSAALPLSQGWLLRILMNFTAAPGQVLGSEWVEAEFWRYEHDPHIKMPPVRLEAGEVALYPVEHGATYNIRLRLVGPLALWSQEYQHTVVWIAELPPVLNLISFYRDNMVWLKWERDPDPVLSQALMEYEVRRGDSWQAGTVISRSPALECPTQGDGTYWVAARLGPVFAAAVDIAVTGSQLPGNILATYDESALGWPGTKTDCEVSGGNLVLSAGETLATYEIAAGEIVDLGALKPCTLSAALAFTVLGFADFDGVTDVDALADFDAAAAGTAQVQMQIAVSSDGSAYGAWQNFSPGVYQLWKVKFRLVLSTDNTSVVPTVTAFSWTVDMPDRTDILVGVSCPALGLTVTFTPAFAVAPAVAVTVRNPAAGDLITFPTPFTVSGGVIQITNGGAGVLRTIDVIAKGG